MIDDMEQLATGKDGRAIDRLLAQSAKGFENLGKIAADVRAEIGDRYTAARAKLVVKQSELREAEDWARFANVPKAEALIATAKELAVFEPAPADLGQRLKGLQELWKEVGAMPQKRSKELWEQFKAACDEIYDRLKGVRAVAEAQYAELSAGKEKLIAEAEALADSTDWAATAEKLKALQAAWKSSGHLPRKLGDELWNRFRAACDKFFDRRKPLLDAAHDEENANALVAKQGLVARAQAIADGARPARAAGARRSVRSRICSARGARSATSRAAMPTRCTRHFAPRATRGSPKRGAARDGEANAHRAELDGLRAEIDAVIAGGEGAVARAIAVRTKLAGMERGAIGDLAVAAEQMVRHVIAAHPEQLKGTELDPAALRGKRDKLIAKATELLPKVEAAPSASAGADDVAARLKAAMRKSAFGGLRFSGRDPVEVIDELRAAWTEIGPLLDAEATAQGEKFAALCQRR